MADLYRNCTAAELRRLTGKETPEEQREACDRLGIAYTRRRISIPGGRGHIQVNECTVWITLDISARLARPLQDCASARKISHFA